MDGKVHFLHLGKCAGTHIKAVCNEINRLSGDRYIIAHKHDVYLKDIPESAPYFFSIREPISRFVSGFYSHKWIVQNNLDANWKNYVDFAYKKFDEANDLAEALFEDGTRGSDAAAAIKSIRHTSQNQIDWFCCHGFFLHVRPPIWIIRQDNFESDLFELLYRANICEHADEILKNLSTRVRNPTNYSCSTELSGKAVRNLKIWYSQDIAFYELCQHWLESETSGA